MDNSNVEVEVQTPPEEVGYRLLREWAGWRPLERDVVTVAGPDAASFLQGQLTQDVAGLAAGASAWSLILAPTGKVDALVRVWRVDADTFVLDTDGGWGPAVMARLARFRLRTKADIEAVDWPIIGVRGPSSAQAAGPGALTLDADSPNPEADSPTPDTGPLAAWPPVARLDASWPGLPGVDLVGPGAVAPQGVARVGPGAWEATRIEAGIPQMGRELTERTIPAEAGIVERTVSFTKGCFTGQELVARIDSRGSNVPRYLRGLRLSGEVEAGTPLVSDGKEVGWVTSVAHSPALGWVALGYVGRAVNPPATLDAAGTTADVFPFPLA